jgi:exonuclease III
MDLIDVYRAFNPATSQYTFFSVAHVSFSNTDHILAHKASLNLMNKSTIYQYLWDTAKAALMVKFIV